MLVKVLEVSCVKKSGNPNFFFKYSVTPQFKYHNFYDNFNLALVLNTRYNFVFDVFTLTNQSVLQLPKYYKPVPAVHRYYKSFTKHCRKYKSTLEISEAAVLQLFSMS